MLELLTAGAVDLARSGVRHGEGLFETIRVRSGVPWHLEDHLQRLGRGAAFLGMAPPPGAGQVLAFLEGHTPCARVAHGCLRLVAVDGQLHVSIQEGLPALPGPVGAALSLRGRRFSGSPLNRFKTLSYLENRLLAREAEDRGLFEVIAPNESGRLTDGSRTSLFMVSGGVLLTPPVADGALPGIARRVLLEAGLARVAPLGPEALAQAPSLMLANALRGALAVHTWEGRALEVSHPLLARAADLLNF